MAFHQLLKPGQSRHLRNWKVPFVYFERFPARENTSSNQNAAGAKTDRFAKAHALLLIAILDRGVVDLDVVVAEAMAGTDKKRSVL